MNKFLEIGIILFIFILVIFTIKVVHGYKDTCLSFEDTSTKCFGKTTLNRQIGLVIENCAYIFDNENVKDTNSILCDKLMKTFENHCTEVFHDWCFSRYWINYEEGKHIQK